MNRQLQEAVAINLYKRFSEIRIGASVEKWGKMNDEKRKYWMGHAGGVLLDIGRYLCDLPNLSLISDSIINELVIDAKETDEMIKTMNENMKKRKLYRGA